MARRHLAGMSSGVALVALLFAVRAGCQIRQEATAPDTNVWESHAATRAALLAAGDADSLEAAGFLTPKDRSNERLQLMQRAAAAAPGRHDLAWAALAECIRVESCDVTPLEARLRAADPGNGAAWMGTLARASAGSPQSQAALAGISGSERFDLYWNQLIVHTADALKRTRTIEDKEAVVIATGLGASQAIPALQRLSGPCRDGAAAQPEELGRCRRLVEALRRGDTLIIEGLGLSLARRVWPASSEEYRQAVEARRVLDYRQSKEDEWSSGLASDAWANRYLERLANHRTEQEALVAGLLASGINPNPPAGWIDPFAAAR